MTTVSIHLTRHGEVENPTGILYGRQPGWGLSDRGRRMAERLGEHYSDPDKHIRALVRSPLQRTEETLAPTSTALGLTPRVDERVIEAGNQFEGTKVDKRSLLTVRNLIRVRNPLRPSWGEPYAHQARRMAAAVATLRRQLEDTAARAGAEHIGGVIVSHQLPIWVARCDAEGRHLWHDPRQRECALGSVTTLTFEQGRLASVDYEDVCADLQPHRARK